MILTPTQEQAIDSGIKAIESGSIYRIGGYAGTGKTTIAKTIIERSGKKAGPCAFMGKASSVLRKKGVPAQTVHSTIYDFDPNNYCFNLKYKLPFDFFFIDEGSTLSLDLWNDVRSFKLPIIVTGDMGQLPPVGKDALLMDDPDIILDVDHRFGSNIANFANTVRSGEAIPKTRNENVQVLNKSFFMKLLFDDPSEIVLCGFNKTRVAINKQVRKHKRYFTPLVEGEKLICLHNDRSLGIYNGMILEIKKIHTEGKSQHGAYSYCDIEKDDGSFQSHMKIWHGHLDKEKQLDWARLPKGMIVVDYAYAISVHKSQGSQFESVDVIDEQCDLWAPQRWRYTAITRASEKIRMYVD